MCVPGHQWRFAGSPVSCPLCACPTVATRRYEREKIREDRREERRREERRHEEGRYGKKEAIKEKGEDRREGAYQGVEQRKLDLVLKWCYNDVAMVL